MPRHYIEKELPYTAEKLFGLVSDIESYPRFLPWCSGARIVEKVSDTVILADLLIRFRGISGKFTSRVFLEPETREINVELAQGPFKHLYQGWKFAPLGDGSVTRVEFDIDFALRSKMMEKVVDIMFDNACTRMMAAFSEEAHKRFG